MSMFLDSVRPGSKISIDTAGETWNKKRYFFFSKTQYSNVQMTDSLVTLRHENMDTFKSLKPQTQARYFNNFNEIDRG